MFLLGRGLNIPYGSFTLTDIETDTVTDNFPELATTPYMTGCPWSRPQYGFSTPTHFRLTFNPNPFKTILYNSRFAT